MNDNTILRIKVPANLYESVKKQLTLTEAKKGGKTYGDWTVVKEKKLPKDGMKKVEEMKDGKKDRSLDELKKAKDALDKKIQEMETSDKKATVEEAVSPEIMDAIGQIVDFAKDNAGFLAGVGGITGIAKMIADKIKQDPEARKALDQKTGAGSTDTSFFEEKKKDLEDK
jgi:uncharacterized membrane protein YdfJ with MMPL/SSD domain